MLREVRLLTIIIIIVITFTLFIIPQVVKTMSADVKVFNLIKFQMILLLSLLLLLLFFQLCTLLRHSVRCQWLGRPRVVTFLLICMFFYLGQTLMHLHACTSYKHLKLTVLCCQIGWEHLLGCPGGCYRSPMNAYYY